MGVPRSDRWQQVKTLFVEALDRDDDARAVFLTEACSADPTLQAEVESLLANERAAGSFAERPAATLLSPSESSGPVGRRLAPGTRLGLYEVTEFISAGGMGEVYRARHSLLGRVVAIKTVNPSLADDSARRRLIREARHASALNHPNICTIYEVGEVNGSPFIVMELVEGISLREHVATTPATVAEILDVAVQVASALEHAHERGIIHRDLKSANVVIDAGGKPTVLDFGLARRSRDRLVDHEGDPTVTVDGAFAGTLSHMAPELLVGGEADARSDIWAFGVLLYEMAAGCLPFAGRTPFETSSAIIGDPLPAIDKPIPLALRLVIERCLEKNPAKRFQHVSDVRDILEHIRRRRTWPIVGRLAVHLPAARRRLVIAAGAGAATLALGGVAAHELRGRLGDALPGPASSLAIIPIEAPPNDSLAAYYAGGVTEALAQRLGSLTRGRIMTASAAARGSNTAASHAKLATQLHADVLVEGRLHKNGDRIAVDVRVIEPRGGRVIWSDAFDRERSDLPALDDDLARGVIAAVRFGIRADAPPEVVRAVNPQAYEEYLKGRFAWNKRTAASLREAVAHFEAAIAADPSFAAAHASLADCYNQFGTQMVGAASPRDARPRAAAEAIRALQIDPYSAEAHAALGYVRHYEWQWAQAEQEFRKAIQLNPSYPFAHLWYANLLMSRRRFAEALAQANAARELDPFSLIINANIAWVLDASGRFVEAREQLERTLALDSTYLQAHMRLVGPLRLTGRPADALREAAYVVARMDSAPSSIAGLASAEASAGHDASARAHLAQLLARARSEYVAPGAIAQVYSSLRDTAGQDRWLERAFAEHSNAIAYLASDQRLWLHDARYQAILRTVGLP